MRGWVWLDDYARCLQFARCSARERKQRAYVAEGWRKQRAPGASAVGAAAQNTRVRISNSAHRVKTTEAIMIRIVPMLTARALTRYSG